MKLIILDRDGVINYDSDNFIKSPEEWRPLPGSLAALARLTHAGYTIVVATNQSGVARGLYDLIMLNQIHEKMLAEVKEAGGKIDAIFYCPHGPWDHCECRKPKPGLFSEIAKHYQQSLQGVPAIGDSFRDLEAATAAGCEAILVLTGNGSDTLAKNKLTNIPVYSDLSEVVKHLLSEPRP